ncbi:uncharacterized protein LOC115388627 [Salarias fasciatus]|uniref:uncharacterized protein LOC115388627 n=1 Tax=Salarias fasciatus TaxID=181472 RepID=UPI001176C119|nr:uncharacterized protein LOC115388627 [Salarias fasciatus]
MMDDKLDSADVDEKVDDRRDNRAELHSSLPSASKSTLNSSTGHTGSATEVSCLSEQIFTEDTELSSSDICLHVFPQTTTGLAGYNLQTNSESERQTAASVCSHSVVEKDEPGRLRALLQPPAETGCVLEVSQESLKTSPVHTEPRGDDLCAAVLLACLFCRPLDCLLATMRGCGGCAWWLCQSLFGCEASALRPVLDAARHCDVCGCLSLPCFTCDCPVCDICLQATECLDLAMEISQMLYK